MREWETKINIKKIFKTILIISHDHPHVKNFQRIFENHGYKVIHCLPDKKEIQQVLTKNTVEIIVLTGILPYKKRYQLCKWLYTNFPTKLYFVTICPDTVEEVMNEILKCDLLQKGKCKPAFLYCTAKYELMVSRFEFLLDRNTKAEIGKFYQVISNLLSYVIQKIGIFPISREEISRYIKSEEIFLILKNLISEISNYIKNYLKDYFNADKLSFFLYDFVEDNYVLTSSYGYKTEKQPTVLQRSWYLVNKVIKTKKPMLIQNGIIHYPEYKKLKIRPQPEIVSSMILPLLIDETLIGILNLARLNPNKEKFTKLDFYLARVFVQNLSHIFLLLLSLQSSLEYEKLKSDFISIVNHELRTPLMALSAAVELVEKDLPQNISDILKRNIKRLDSLILHLLDFSRIGKGTFKVVKKQQSVKELLDEIIIEYKPIIEKQNIKFLIETEEIQPDIIMFDKERIRQILTNFLNNAIKFSSEEKTNRYIKFVVKDEDKFVHFYVEDNGIGIKKEDIKKLFTPFIQVGDVMTDHKPGLGLGLYISKEIAKQHQGKIWIESEYNKWTRVHLLLPKKQPPISEGRG